jgi:hypothetical protein
MTLLFILHLPVVTAVGLPVTKRKMCFFSYKIYLHYQGKKERFRDLQIKLSIKTKLDLIIYTIICHMNMTMKA